LVGFCFLLGGNLTVERGWIGDAGDAGDVGGFVAGCCWVMK